MSRLVFVCAMLAVCLPALAQTSFYDDFNSPALDPAWTVVSYTGTRSYGFTTPANSYSLTASPGNLRYSLEAMTHEWGFVTSRSSSRAQTRDLRHASAASGIRSESAPEIPCLRTG